MFLESKHRRSLFIGVLVSSVLLYFSLKGVSWTAAFKVIRGVPVHVVVVSFALMVATVALSALRWQRIVCLDRPIRLTWAARVTFISCLGNNVMPARFGDLLRMYLLQQSLKTPVSFAISTVFCERLLDVIVLVAILLVASPFALVNKLVHVEWLIPVALLGAVGTLLALLFRNAFVKLPSVQWLLTDWKQTLVLWRRHSNRNKIAQITMLSFAIWAIWAFLLWMNLSALGTRLSLGGILTIVAVSNLGLVIPSAPSGIGTFEFLLVFLLGFFGLDKDSALAFAIYFHLLVFLPPSIIGIFCWLGMGPVVRHNVLVREGSIPISTIPTGLPESQAERS